MAARNSLTQQKYPWFNNPMREVVEFPDRIVFYLAGRPLLTMWRGADHVTVHYYKNPTQPQIKAVTAIVRHYQMTFRYRAEAAPGRWGYRFPESVPAICTHQPPTNYVRMDADVTVSSGYVI